MKTFDNHLRRRPSLVGETLPATPAVRKQKSIAFSIQSDGRTLRVSIPFTPYKLINVRKYNKHYTPINEEWDGLRQ